MGAGTVRFFVILIIYRNICQAVPGMPCRGGLHHEKCSKNPVFKPLFKNYTPWRTLKGGVWCVKKMIWGKTKKTETTKKYYISINNPYLIKRTVEPLDSIYKPTKITLLDGTMMTTMPTSNIQRTKRIDQLKNTPTKK